MIEMDAYYFAVLGRLVVAIILGGIIGLERGGTNHDAGLRTHILLCLGAATVMVISEYVGKSADVKTDILRMGAQVISGIGFLGVGSIIVTGNKVRGLTTAAGLWTTACVGLAVGLGYYFIAIPVVILMLATMWGLRPLTSKLQSRSIEINMQIELMDRNAMAGLFKFLNDMDISIVSAKIEDKTKEGLMLNLEIKVRRYIDKESFITKISAYDGVTGISVL